MHKDLQTFINGIKETTGIALSVYDREGKVLFGENFAENLSISTIKEVFCDQAFGVTLFPISLNNEEFIIALKGVSQTERSLAIFIREYAQKTFGGKVLSIEEFLKGILLGEYSKEQIDKMQAGFDLSFSSAYCVYLTSEDESMPEVSEFLINLNEGNSDYFLLLNAKEGVFIRFNQAEFNDFISPKDYAGFLVRSVYEETGKNVKIHVGTTVGSLFELARSYERAKKIALLGENANAKSVNSVEDYFFIELLGEISNQKINEYYKSIRTEGTDEFFNSPELLETAKAFFENDLNASQTSRKTYLHRNTLNYRLEKIQRLTGLDIRNFYDAIALRTMIIIHRMVKK